MATFKMKKKGHLFSLEVDFDDFCKALLGQNCQLPGELIIRAKTNYFAAAF